MVVHSRAGLVRDFQALGVAAGDVVMLHASIKAVGAIVGGPDQIHLALKEALTSRGTLTMYASCPAHYDEVGRGHLTAAQEREILSALPPFDARTARSQRENGALVELFRTWPDSRVNDHVARFVVWGAQTERLLTPQPWDFAFGRDSLLERFVDLGGKILLLGCDHDNVTFLHYAEHIADIRDKIVARFKVPILEGGVRIWKEMAEVDTAERAHATWPDRFFAKIVDAHLTRTGNAGALVGDARAYLIDARSLLADALETMARVAAS